LGERNPIISEAEEVKTAVAKYKIAWLPGDGIGKDVMDAARIVLDDLRLDAEYIPGDVGWEFWCSEGEALPERTVELLETTDCCLFGAITSKPKDEAEQELVPELKGKGLVYFSPIVRMRQLLDLYTNMRPCKAYPGNPLNYRDDIDLVVFRENTEDLYAGVEFYPLPDEVRQALVKNHPKMRRFAEVPADEIAISCRILTKQGCRRILRKAFEHARSLGRPSVTVVEKPNVIRETSGMMIREARNIAKEYPEIQLWETNVDAMAMWLVKNPQDYSILASSNMFGDIISDLCAQLVGGLGFASSANIGDNYAVFEPTHGSAPKYAGQYKVNPMAMLLTVKLMLDWLGEVSLAQRLESGIAGVIAEGKVRTYDMGGTDNTLEVAEAVARRL
jgi:isocitrate/isopropylmalate dehydrogenase